MPSEGSRPIFSATWKEDDFLKEIEENDKVSGFVVELLVAFRERDTSLARFRLVFRDGNAVIYFPSGSSSLSAILILVVPLLALYFLESIEHINKTHLYDGGLSFGGESGDGAERRRAALGRSSNGAVAKGHRSRRTRREKGPRRGGDLVARRERRAARGHEGGGHFC